MSVAHASPGLQISFFFGTKGTFLLFTLAVALLREVWLVIRLVEIGP